MIISILVILCAFYWLLKETDYLRVRFVAYGSIEQEPVIRKAWDEIQTDILNLPDKYQPFWIKHPENMQPLCGLEWLENNTHIIPEYKIQLNMYGVRYKMTVKQASVIKDVMKVNKITKAQKLAYAGI